jgi:hypothetical protein
MDFTGIYTVALLCGLSVGGAQPPCAGSSGTCAVAPPRTCSWPSGYYTPYTVYGHGYPWRRWHASTAAEGWLRGWAAYTQGVGTYNYLTGQAMIFREQAREHAIHNSRLATETYFEKRRINHEARFPTKPLPNQPFAAEVAKPVSLKPALPNVYDAATGGVAWPSGLRGDELAAARAAVEAALAADHGANLRGAVAEVQQQLKARIKALPPAEYVAATKFCQALRLEGGPDAPQSNLRLAGNP